MKNKASAGSLRLVNRAHTIAADYVPGDLVAPGNYGVPVANPEIRLQRCACIALAALVCQARAEGAGEIVLYSGYRSYEAQKNLHRNKIRRLCMQGMPVHCARVRACTVVAPPGASEHQTGLAADVTVPEFLQKNDPLIEDFAKTTQGAWLRERAQAFGFVLRYPADKTDYTGVCFEPWHLRYVGPGPARGMHQEHKCLEEYLYLR